MTQHLFLASFLMFVSSTAVLFILFAKRMADIRAGTTDPMYFKTYDLATQIPRQTKQIVRNYNNQFETPTLFYAVIALILAMDLAHLHLVILAYAYVVARGAHTFIHLTHNKLRPRMVTFFLSIAILIALWLRSLFEVFS